MKEPSITVLIGLLSLVAAGCSRDFLSSNPNRLPAQDPILSDGISQPQTPYAGPSLYCYKTLADVDCHAEPIPKSEGRLVEKYQGSPTVGTIDVVEIPVQVGPQS